MNIREYLAKVDSVIEKEKMFHYLIDDRRNYHDLEKERLTEEMGE